jgi:hypothetical protein
VRALPLVLLAALLAPAAHADEHHLGGSLRVDGTPLVVGPGDVVVLDPGTLVTGNASIQVTGGTLRAAGTPASPVQITIPIVLASGDCRLEDARVWGVGGTALDARGGNLTIERSAFAENGRHLLVETTASVNDSDFGATVDGPGVIVRGEGAALLERNVFHDAGVALRVEGGRVASRGDAFHGNRVGVSVANATVDLVGDAFDKEADVERGPGANVSLVGATFGTTAPAPSRWLAPAALALAAGGALAGAYAWGRRRGRAPAAAAPATPPPAVDLGAPLRPTERRVLEDLAAHPGSAQSAAAQRLGLTRQALHYHVKKLAARGLVRKEARGRETLCSVPPEVAAALGLQEAPNTSGEVGGR